MANIKDKMLYFVGNKLLKYVYKNPQKNMLKLIKIGKAEQDSFLGQLRLGLKKIC